MPDEYLEGLIRKHRSAGVVTDTNLLLVLLIGLCDRKMIEKFKRTQKYTAKDFDLLLQLLAQFERIITTPSILTEVNSLANQLEGKHKALFYGIFRERLTVFVEEHRAPREVSEHVFFPKCGLCDSTILTIAERGLLVLTDDLPLTQFLEARKVDCINFNHIRTFRF